MGILTTVSVGTVAVVGAAAAISLRRRFSKDWIDMKDDATDLTGKTIIITGGNVGLGYETALDLAKRNAHVVIGCRNVEKGQEAVRMIQKATTNKNNTSVVECLHVDLADLDSVRKFAETIKTKYKDGGIYALVLNAGVWVPMDQHIKTTDGFEIHFGVNHLAHFELAKLLKDHLSVSDKDNDDDSNSRIVFVSSSLARSGKIDFTKQDFVWDGRRVVPTDGNGEDDDKHGDMSFAPTGYCDSKLMNALTSRHLATLLPASVTTYAVCPGFCRSSLNRHVKLPLYKRLLLMPIFLMIQRTTKQGAQNIVFTVVTDKNQLESGQIYTDGKVIASVSDNVDNLGPDAPKKLWQLSEELTNDVDVVVDDSEK